MPAIGEKQPRWLMGCKCGAMVKASANGTGSTPLGVRYLARRAVCARIWQKPCRRTATSGQAASRTRNDRGRLEGRDHGNLEGGAMTLEQQPPLERTRVHNLKTGQDPFP